MWLSCQDLAALPERRADEQQGDGGERDGQRQRADGERAERPQHDGE